MDYRLTTEEKIYIESILKEHESLLIEFIKKHQFDNCFFDRDHVNRKVLRFSSSKTDECSQVNFVMLNNVIEIFDEEIDMTNEHPAYCKYFGISFDGLKTTKWRLGIFYIPICNRILKIFRQYQKGLK